VEQQDFLLRQLQQMTQAIVALIRRLTGLKEQGTEEEMKQVTDIFLKEYFDTSLQEIAQLPLDKCIEFLTIDKKMHSSVADLFAEVLIANSTYESDKVKMKKLLEKALLILEWVDKSSGTFSQVRQEKMNAVRNELSNLK
jgi:hypothetical protein